MTNPILWLYDFLDIFVKNVSFRSLLFGCLASAIVCGCVRVIRSLLYV